MGLSDFVGWNIIVVGVIIIAIFVYLIVLFQKRRNGSGNKSGEGR